MDHVRIVTAALLALAACSHAKSAEQPSPQPLAVRETPAPEATPPPAAQSVAPAEEPAPPAPPPAARAVKPIEATASVYFDFDRAELTPDSLARLRALADAAAQPGARVRIEGNCDERGTTEYNLGLGQRRADAAKKYLERLGVPAASMTAISYGKERPKLLGHDEESWRENRRADLFVQPGAFSALDAR